MAARPCMRWGTRGCQWSAAAAAGCTYGGLPRRVHVVLAACAHALVCAMLSAPGSYNRAMEGRALCAGPLPPSWA